MHAAAAGNVETVKFLISRGANIHATDNMRWTALHHAVSSGGFEVTQALVEAGADVNARTFNKATVLMRAVQARDFKEKKYVLISYKIRMSSFFFKNNLKFEHLLSTHSPSFILL